MTAETEGPFGVIIEERIVRDMGADRSFFLANPDRRHRVREALPIELAASEAELFTGWPIYAAVALRPHGRVRVLFACTEELRVDLPEHEAAELFADVSVPERMADAELCGKVVH